MDLEYLLVLQNLRESLSPVVDNVLLGLTLFCDGPALVALALIVFWCIDKRVGLFAILCMGVGNFTSQFLKNIVCIYRPWVLDSRITPVEAAMSGAGGYSFPSGHATGAGSFFGGIAWQWRKNRKAIAVICIALILVVCFSRNYLGVHTPQDVLAGLAIAAMTIALMNMFTNWLDKKDASDPGNKIDIAVVAVVLVLCVASLAVVELKAYPMHYVDGQLLVDPETMKKGSYEAAGMIGGIVVGWALERHFVQFSTGPHVSVRMRAVRSIVGVALCGSVYFLTDILFKMILPYNIAKLCAYFALAAIAMFVVPLAFSALERKRGRRQA